MNTQTTKNRETYADALKCLGILLVIRGHVTLFGFGETDTYSNMHLLMSYAFNMPIFFFLSGYFAYKQDMSIKGIAKNVWNKSLILIVPAIAFYAYDCLICDKPITNLINDGFGKYWFTITLFMCFLIYYTIKAVISSRTIQNTVLITLSLAGIVYLSLFGRYEIPLLDFNHLSKYFQYFVAGLFAKMYQDRYFRIISNQLLITLATIFFFVMLPVVCHNLLPGIAHKMVRDLLIRYAGTFMIISWFYRCRYYFTKDNSVNHIIAYIGHYTLPIYLLQYFFLPNFSMFNNIMGLDTITTDIICFAYSVINITICIIFIQLISNSTFIKKFLFGIKS